MRITLLAGESKTVSVAGGRFYFESGMGRIRVKTLGVDSSEFELKSGMGFQNREDRPNFSAVDIKNLESYDQNIDFIITYREVFDNRAVGVVKVVNSDRQRTELGQAFLQGSYKEAVAGLYSSVMLHNKVGSTKNIFVNRVYLQSAADIDIQLFTVTNVSGILTDALTSNVSVLGIAGNKLIGGADSSSGEITVFHRSSAVYVPYGEGRSRFMFGSRYIDYRFTEPFMLMPGKGLSLVGRAVNTLVQANWEWFEE